MASKIVHSSTSTEFHSQLSINEWKDFFQKSSTIIFVNIFVTLGLWQFFVLVNNPFSYFLISKMFVPLLKWIFQDLLFVTRKRNYNHTRIMFVKLCSRINRSWNLSRKERKILVFCHSLCVCRDVIYVVIVRSKNPEKKNPFFQRGVKALRKSFSYHLALVLRIFKRLDVEPFSLRRN